MEKTSLHMAATAATAASRGCSSWRLPRAAGMAASPGTLSQSPRSGLQSSSGSATKCQVPGSLNPCVTHPNSSAHPKPPTAENPKHRHVSIGRIKILIAIETLLPQSARQGLCLLISSKLSLMLRRTGSVINGVWRDVLWVHHRALYLLPLASCQFVPYLFSELIFIGVVCEASLHAGTWGAAPARPRGSQPSNSLAVAVAMGCVPLLTQKPCSGGCCRV